jgi:hypothetical protein
MRRLQRGKTELETRRNPHFPPALRRLRRFRLYRDVHVRARIRPNTRPTSATSAVARKQHLCDIYPTPVCRLASQHGPRLIGADQGAGRRLPCRLLT